MKNIKKEYIFILIIIVIIVSLEIVTNKITEHSTDKVFEELCTIKDDINNLNENYEQVKEKIETLETDWDKEEKKLSYFGEHDELEKIGHAISLLKENFNNREYTVALNYNAEALYWLNHFCEKDEFKLKNIF